MHFPIVGVQFPRWFTWLRSYLAFCSKTLNKRVGYASYSNITKIVCGAQMMTTKKSQALEPRAFLKGVALIAMVFGAVTVISGGSVLFGTDVVREAAGHFVPFVLWFNFIAGFAYIAAGLAIWLAHRWAFGLSIAIAVATFFVATAFGVWVFQGGAYEMRSVGALSLRFGVWLAISLVMFRARSRP